MGGAITGDGEGTEEKKEGDRYSPNLGSAPTFQPFQPCLHLWFRPIVVAVRPH